MIRKLKKIIGYYLYRDKISYENFRIAGVNLKGIKGTYRKKTDKDDAWFFALAQNSEHVFDIGSNVGYMALISAIQKNNRSVLLVDPNPEALSKAAQNMIINGFGLKSKFITAFVGDIDGEKVKFYTVGSGAAGSMFSSHAETAAAVGSYYMVEKITIDTLVEKSGYFPDLIKIDVEGAESLTLRGAKKTASKQISKFFIEMHSPAELPMIKNTQLVLDWCKENNYKSFYLKNHQELINAEEIAHRGKCHLLLLPINQSYPEYLKTIKEGSVLPSTL